MSPTRGGSDSRRPDGVSYIVQASWRQVGLQDGASPQETFDSQPEATARARRLYQLCDERGFLEPQVTIHKRLWLRDGEGVLHWVGLGDEIDVFEPMQGEIA